MSFDEPALRSPLEIVFQFLGSLESIDESDWEEQMRDLSRRLGSYLMGLKKRRERQGKLQKTGYTIAPTHLDMGKSKIISTTTMKPPTAYVTILREGYIKENEKDYKMVASITLIRDQGKIILVDTGLATDINGRTDLVESKSTLRSPMQFHTPPRTGLGTKGGPRFQGPKAGTQDRVLHRSWTRLPCVLPWSYCYHGSDHMM